MSLQLPDSLRPRMPPGRLTFEEFMDWAEYGTHVEWVDGDVVWLGSVDIRHADLKGFLQSLIRSFSEERQPGRVLGRPFLMKLSSGLPARSPDILFLACERKY
ncbi:MAG TPA: Uma2 family endonuclease, partial [Armatimonadota bacterium]|nr:Uma2 family endonuclease [Armatimonadota bacterium]